MVDACSCLRPSSKHPLLQGALLASLRKLLHRPRAPGGPVLLSSCCWEDVAPCVSTALGPRSRDRSGWSHVRSTDAAPACRRCSIKAPTATAGVNDPRRAEMLFFPLSLSPKPFSSECVAIGLPSGMGAAHVMYDGALSLALGHGWRGRGRRPGA